MSDEGNFWEGAKCAEPQNNPDWWDTGPNQNKALQICDQCPISLKCLLYAVENNEHYLIWGGMLPSERQNLRLRAK